MDRQYFLTKIRTLKLLALKIAAHGRWDLEALMKTVPGPLVLKLLQELLIATCGKLEVEDETLMHTLTDPNNSDHHFFALLLYHRWCVQTVLQDCLPKKPMKVNSIPVPGLTEPVIQMVGISEEKLARIKKLFGKCKSTLVDGLNLNRKACLPTQECFAFSESVMGEMSLCWDKGVTQGVEYWGRQVAYDLGTVYFYETDFYKALDMFTKVELWNKSVSCKDGIPLKTLSGYLKSCQAVVHSKRYDENVVNAYHTCIVQKDLENLVGILTENFETRKLPATAADQTALLLAQIRDDIPDNLPKSFMEVECLCHILFTLRGDCYYLQRSTEKHKYLVNMISKILEYCSTSEKKNLAAYLQHLLCEEGPPMQSMMKSFEPIKALLGFEVLDKKPSDMLQRCTTSPLFSLLDRESYDSSDSILASTFNQDEIWTLLCTMHAQGNLKVVIDYWKLPKDLDRLFGELTIDVASVCAYVLIAKAKELISVKEHNHAVILLNAADKTIRDVSGKIAKIIRWEVLYSNLLSAKISGSNPQVVDIDKKVKSCLCALKVDSDIFPHESLVMECVSHLLLSKDWEYLSSLHDTRVAFTEYARQLINVCKELPGVQHAKAPAKVLWDTSVYIFLQQNTGKRVRLGNQAMLPKETYKKFILTVNEPLVLSVLISLLTRIYNLTNSDIDIDRTNNFCAVWPDAISNNMLNTLDGPYIKELMVQLVQHALSINPLQSTWLKTYAEIQYALGNREDALKWYLRTASVASNHFMQPISGFVFDNEVYTRLVKCCVDLKHYTQAAVLLSQFFEEPDYIGAFKYLQEKDCQDGMDIYYDCLWDVNIIEFLIYLHDKKGELDKKQQLIQLMGNPELNSNNPDSVLQLFKTQKRAQFFRIMHKQFV
ncbi:integrator complex subunit 8-like [Watersipora subatra]|uniref:integrator complex subunit 8-like n=1 Tax=Watersipora subatra TaxID=2589382 RepID=UPI00355C8E00